MFYLGHKGTRLASKHSGWISQDSSFRKSVRLWNIIGWSLAIITILGTFLVTSDVSNQKQMEEYYRNEVIEMLSNNTDAISMIGNDMDVVNYNISNRFNSKDISRSVLVRSNEGDFFILIRVDDDLEITELLVSESDDFSGNELSIVN